MMGLVPVREFATVEEMRAHGKAVRDRLFGKTQTFITIPPAPPLSVVKRARKSRAKKPPEVPVAVPPRPAPPAARPLPRGPRDILHVSSAGLSAHISARIMVAEIAAQHGLSVDEMLGPRRAKRITKARHAAVARIALAFPQWSLPKVGQFFGRDHTTVLNSLKRAGVTR